MIQAFIGNVGTCTTMLTEKSQVENLHKDEIGKRSIGADEIVVRMKFL